MSTYSVNKNYLLMAAGEQSGTWGDPATNGNWNAVDANLAGRYPITVTGLSTVALTTGQAQNLIYPLSGTLGNNLTITFPATGGPGVYIFNAAAVVQGGGGPYSITIASSGGGSAVIPVGATTILYNDGTNIVIVTGSSATPVGLINDFGGSTAPPGWLLCNGAAYSTGSYGALFAVIGYSFGGSSGSFNVPDLQGRFTAGYDPGNATGRLNGSGFSGGVDASAIGHTGGQQSHQLTSNELASHQHDLQNHYHTPPTGIGASPSFRAIVSSLGDRFLQFDSGTPLNHSSFVNTSGPTPNITGSAGGNGFHNTVPPVQIVQKIIYAGR